MGSSSSSSSSCFVLEGSQISRRGNKRTWRRIERSCRARADIAQNGWLGSSSIGGAGRLICRTQVGDSCQLSEGKILSLLEGFRSSHRGATSGELLAQQVSLTVRCPTSGQLALNSHTWLTCALAKLSSFLQSLRSLPPPPPPPAVFSKEAALESD